MLSLQWGTMHFEEHEVERPGKAICASYTTGIHCPPLTLDMLFLSADFQGELITSYIDGRQVLHFPSHRRTVYVVQSCVGVSLLLALALGVVVSIYLVRFSIEEDIGIANAQLVASALNATQIQVLNYCYRHILTQLTNRENHRTETQVGLYICFLLYCIISYSLLNCRFYSTKTA